MPMILFYLFVNRCIYIVKQVLFLIYDKYPWDSGAMSNYACILIAAQLFYVDFLFWN